MTPRSVQVLVASFIALLVVVVPTDADAAGLQSWTGTVTRVVDGDTFEVRLTNGTEQTIRVAGINTNETSAEPKCWADEATSRLEGLVMGKSVRLEARDAGSSAQGRPFRHVFVGSTNVAAKMLREGYGVPFLLPAEADYLDRYVAAFYEAADAARRIHDHDACGSGPSAQLEMLVNGDADGTDTENLNGEFVQLRNTGSDTVSLNGWRLHDSAVDYYDFPANASIKPGGVLTIHVGSGVDKGQDLYMGFSRPIYSNIDGAFLLDPDGDMRAFDTWPCHGMCGPAALPRLVIDDVQYDWPGGNDDHNPNGEWVKFRNAGPSSIDLRDWSFVSYPYVVYSTSSRVLAPGETLTLYIGQGSNSRYELYWNKEKSILNNEGDSISAVSPHGDVAVCRAWGTGSCGDTPAKGWERHGSDFDGDGFDDLAVGIPGEDLGKLNSAGSLVVIPGEQGGPKPGSSSSWNQTGPIPGAAESGDEFGAAVSAGDFDGDGYDDLAVGVPGEDVGSLTDAGVVSLVYGSRDGLDSAATADLGQKGPLVGAAEPHDRFGAAVAAGDFDGDGFSDLAVGVPGENNGSGLVNVVYGTTGGLGTAGNHAFSQSGSVVGSPESGDGFGSSLAVGDFDGDGYDDLAVGVPDEAVGSTAAAGVVNVLYGSSGGLTTSGNDLFGQSGPIVGAAEAGDRFGAALSAGDIDGDGFEDLVVGVPGEDLSGKSDAGTVVVIYGSGSGLTSAGNQGLSQAGDIAGAPESGDQFGAAVGVGDFDGDGFADVMIGAPGEGLSGKSSVGVVHIVFGSGGGVVRAGNVMFDQGRAGGNMEAGDRFGTTVAAFDLDGDGRDDIVGGAPNEDLAGGNDAGSLGVIFGRADGIAPRSPVGLSQDGSIPGVSEPNDRFGGAL